MMTELQTIELNILKEIDRVCRENGIEYMLSGGSVLGAVRHGGFIPWDDDIDINMIRDEYERFLEIAETKLNQPYKLRTYNNDKTHHYYFTHVVNTEYHVRRTGSLDKRVEDVWVDIYPIDGLPAGRVRGNLYYIKLQFIRMFYHLGFFERINIARPNRPVYQLVIIKLYERFHNLIRINGEKWRSKLDYELKKYNPRDSRLLMNYIGMYGKREIFPREVFLETKSYKFEDMEIAGPEDYELYLGQLYGDWRKPPTNKQTHPMELLFEEAQRR